MLTITVSRDQLYALDEAVFRKEKYGWRKDGRAIQDTTTGRWMQVMTKEDNELNAEEKERAMRYFQKRHNDPLVGRN